MSKDYLEALENLKDMLIGNGVNDNINEYVDNLILPIKQALINAQEQEKDVKILKRKLESIQDERVRSAKHHIQLQKNIDKFKKGYCEIDDVLKIIFKKNVNIGLFVLCDSVKEYNKNYKGVRGLTQEEFDLLKKWGEKYEC